MMKRVHVSFKVHQHGEAEAVIELMFTQEDGVRLPMQGKRFAFDLTPDTSPMEAQLVAHALNHLVTHLVMTEAANLEHPLATHSLDET